MEEKNKKNMPFKIFALVLILIILIFSKRENQEKFIEALNLHSLLLDELDIVNSISISKEVDNIAYYDNCFFIWQKDNLTRYDEKGSKEWEKSLSFVEPYIVFGQESIYICDKNLGDIHYLNLEGDTISRFKVEGTISGIKEYSQHILVHVREDNKEGLKLLDKNGNLLSKFYVDDGNILNYSLNDKNNIYAYSMLKLENENINSEIIVSSLEGNINWHFQVEDELIMYLAFVDEEKLIAMSDKGLYCIDKGKILWQIELIAVKDICITGENIHILYDKIYEIISSDGIINEKVTFTEDYNKLILTDDYAIVYGNNNIMGIKGKNKIFKYKSEEPITKVAAVRKNLIVLYESKIDIISFIK